jgi:hypothetical protein
MVVKVAHTQVWHDGGERVVGNFGLGIAIVATTDGTGERTD